MQHSCKVAGLFLSRSLWGNLLMLSLFYSLFTSRVVKVSLHEINYNSLISQCLQEAFCFPIQLKMFHSSLFVFYIFGHMIFTLFHLGFMRFFWGVLAVVLFDAGSTNEEDKDKNSFRSVIDWVRRVICRCVHFVPTYTYIYLSMYICKHVCFKVQVVQSLKVIPGLLYNVSTDRLNRHAFHIPTFPPPFFPPSFYIWWREPPSMTN